MGRDMGPDLEEIRQLKEERDSWRRVSERLEHEKQELISRLQIAEEALTEIYLDSVTVDIERIAAEALEQMQKKD